MPSNPSGSESLFERILAYASYFFFLGKTAGGVLASALLRFLGAGADVVAAAVDAGRMAADAGGRLSFMFNKRLTDRFIPINPALPNQYRYTVVLRCTTDEPGVFVQRRVVIDSDERLTFEQLTWPAKEAWTARREDYPRGRRRLEPKASACDIFGVQSIQRRS